MNDEHVVAVRFLLDVTGEWIPSTVIIQVAALLFTPGANQIVLLLIVKSYVRISPRCLGVTHISGDRRTVDDDRLAIACEPLLPCSRSLRLLELFNYNILPFDGSCDSTWLGNQVT